MLSSSLPAVWSLLGVGSGPGVGACGPSSRGPSEGPGSTLVGKAISMGVACNVKSSGGFTISHPHCPLCYSCAELPSHRSAFLDKHTSYWLLPYDEGLRCCLSSQPPSFPRPRSAFLEATWP